MTTNWSISTDDGLWLGEGSLVGLIAVQHRRLVDTWRTLGPAEWAHPSRNVGWSVHETARHVADGVERVAATVAGERDLDETDFDPLSTPAEWLGGSAGESPEATMDRLGAASMALTAGVEARLAAGDESHAPTVYGTAHWTVNVAHLLWDSWIHERDVLLPLDRPAPSTDEEQRLVALYGVLMALVPAVQLGLSVDLTVELRGAGARVVEATCHAGAVRSAEAPDAAAAMSAPLPELVDALTGRGVTVADLLPDAPEELGILAAYFNR